MKQLILMVGNKIIGKGIKFELKLKDEFKMSYEYEVGMSRYVNRAKGL